MYVCIYVCFYVHICIHIYIFETIQNSRQHFSTINTLTVHCGGNIQQQVICLQVMQNWILSCLQSQQQPIPSPSSSMSLCIAVQTILQCQQMPRPPLTTENKFPFLLCLLTCCSSCPPQFFYIWQVVTSQWDPMTKSPTGIHKILDCVLLVLNLMLQSKLFCCQKFTCSDKQCLLTCSKFAVTVTLLKTFTTSFLQNKES